MKVKCDYCGNMIDEKEHVCPNCGAALSGVNRVAGGQPKTIEDLKQWYIDHNLPPENVTRFFIGKNIKESRAFGIYQDDSGDFVVYKNKSDGSRAVRYRGSDEAYAVNELYQRLKAEISDQKSRNARQRSSQSGNGGRRKTRGSDSIGLIIFAAVFGLMMIFAIFDKSPSSGYYRYNGNDYYYQNSSWYYYDALNDDWYKAENSDELSQSINSDNDSEYRVYDHEGKSFESTSWYDVDDDDGWDSDSSWDSSDSWDSGDTDWDSDW